MRGFGLATYTLDMFAAPSHTIHLQVWSGPCVNSRLVIAGRSKRFVPLAQSIHVLSRGVCTIEVGLWARNTHLGDVCTSSARDSAPRDVNGRLVIEGRGNHFVFSTQSTEVQSRGVRTIDAGLWARNIHVGDVCSSRTRFSSK